MTDTTNVCSILLPLLLDRNQLTEMEV